MLLLDAKISISINSASMVCSSVKLENIRKSSKGVIMLKYVTWEVKRGERAGLVSFSGAGEDDPAQDHQEPDSGYVRVHG